MSNTYVLDPRSAFLDRHDIAEMFKCGESKIRALEGDPARKFPKPIRLGDTSTPVWMFSDLLAWAAENKA